MKFATFLGALVLLAVIGGATWLAVSDVSVEQTEIRTVIPSDRFQSTASPN